MQLSIPPAFETSRLRLRAFRVEDAAALHEALVESIAELRQHLWFLPWISEEQTPESAEARCRQAQANFITRADLPYLAFAKDSGRLVASMGLHRTDWSVPKTEVGYWVRTSETGRGFAREGVEVLVGWALSELRAVRVELVTLESNAASRAVAERCGFALEGIHRNVMRGPDGALKHRYVYAKFPATA